MRSIKVSLKMGKDMVRVSISISMVIFTKENGETEREKVKELFFTFNNRKSTQECLWIIKEKEKVFWSIKREKRIKVISRTTNERVTEFLFTTNFKHLKENGKRI